MASIGAVPSSANLTSNSSLGLQDFLNILISQLSFQDPLKPVDNQQFMAQMAQFSALQQSQELNTKMDSLLTTQASLQSVGLIGRTVDVSLSNGSPLSGTVVSLSLSGSAPTISVRDSAGTVTPSITLDQITAVRTTT